VTTCCNTRTWPTTDTVFASGTMVVRSNLQLVALTAEQDWTAWVTSVTSGLPVARADVQIYTSQYGQVGQVWGLRECCPASTTSLHLTPWTYCTNSLCTCQHWLVMPCIAGYIPVPRLLKPLQPSGNRTVFLNHVCTPFTCHTGFSRGAR
jgi:hypothetical protein